MNRTKSDLFWEAVVILTCLGVLIWASIYYIYPYMKRTTSHPILFTVLIGLGSMLIVTAFVKVDNFLLSYMFGISFARIISRQIFS